MTGVCTTPVWLEVSDGLLPPLELSDALLLGSVTLGIFALAFGFKTIRRFLFR